MTTWRDTTSEHVQSDLDRLLNTVLPFADEMLRRHGEFYPYGAAITREGEEQVFAADPGETEDPNPSEVLTSPGTSCLKCLYIVAGADLRALLARQVREVAMNLMRGLA